MKGIMVTLLMFLTTGIVVGQQGSSSSNSVNPASAGSQSHLFKPLEIGVSAEKIRDLRQGKRLFSPIEPVSESGEQLDRNVVNGVTLYPEGKSLGSLAKRTVRGRDNGDGVLLFGLSDSDLDALQSNQLSMEFDPSEQGRYRAIGVFYENSAQTQNSATTRQTTRQTARQTARPSNDNAFSAPPANRTPTARAPAARTRTPDNSASSNQFAFGHRNNTTNNSARNSAPTPFIPLPAPHEPGDIDFMGPTLPSAGSWRPPNQTTQNNPALNPDRQNHFANNQNNSGWTFPERDNGGFQSSSRQNTQQDNFEDNRQAILDEMKAKWEAEQAQQEYLDQMARQNARQNLERIEHEKEVEREFAHWKWQQEQELARSRTQTPLLPVLSGPAVPGSRLTADQQLAYNHAIWEIERREKLVVSQEETVKRKQALLDEREYNFAVATRNNNLGNQPRGGYIQNANQTSTRSNGDTPGMHLYPPNNNSDVEPEPNRSNDYARNQVDQPDNGFRSPRRNHHHPPRVASSTEHGISNYKTAVAGPSSATSTGSRDDRVDGFVLFLLLCSLGLNFYLAFISRGFYVRYHELADELRETFSTTHH